MSSNDFDGPHFQPVSGRGADEQGAQALGANGQGAGGNPAKYPAPEGWGNDGIWRDSAIDSNYETGVQRAVPPPSASHEDPGYSYFSDGKGWENRPGANARPGEAPGVGAGAAAATSVGATSVSAAGAGAYRPGGAPTAVYGGGSAGTGGYGAPMGPGAGAPGGPGGWGPGGPGGPAGPGPGGPGWGAGGPAGPGGPVRPGGPMGPGGPRGPMGRNGKRKGNWWRHWTWKKALAVTGGVFVLFFLALFSGYEYLSSSATIPTALASATYQNTTVYYADGKTVMGTIGATNRQDLTYQQIPKQLQNAVIAAEDKNFWTEGGISPTGILRAAIHDVTSGGGDLNGGSTITQEFVRGYYDGVGTQQTASRKIKEIFIAQKLAATKSKQWILTHYLNLIYLGKNSNGVAAAAQTYFGVPASKLTVAQDAVIAGIIQQPSTYPLLSNRAALKARWTYVLQQMVADGYITQAQMSTMKFPKMLTDAGTSSSRGTSVTAHTSEPWARYLMTQVQNELVQSDGITDQQLETGGYKVVTTISRSKEAALYKAVSENLNSQSIRNTSGATVTSLPPWALVGAELQNPKTGEIIAEYPGKGQNLTPAQCDGTCMNNTAWQSREQVGSSFKPYVLSTAVSQGMNVQSSVLNTSPYLCVAPDNSPDYSVPITQGTYDMPGSPSTGCANNSAFKVENDAGELIGKKVGEQPSGGNKGATYYSDNVQDALAQSSNTGFTDLAHKAGTANIVNMAQQFGVNTGDYPAGSGLKIKEGQVGLALGTASLTVQEQTTMLSTIANNGSYHQAHLVKYWQANGTDAAKQTPKVVQRMVLNPQQAQDVQYAMEKTTIDGTAAQTVTFGQQNLGTVIGKTGTTTDSKSGFFIGATTQYSLVVGMFTKNPKATQNLEELGGGGFGGYWPAKIWNSFAQAEFSPAAQTFPTNPTGAGTAWNMLGKVPKAAKKPACTETFNGQRVSIITKGCPTPKSKTCTFDSKGNYVCGNGIGKGNNGNGQNPDPTATCQFQGDPTCGPGGFQNPTPTATCQFQGDPTCNGATFSGNSTSATTAAKAGLAVGGGLMILPGSLLWTTVSRRRRKKRAGRAE